MDKVYLHSLTAEYNGIVKSEKVENTYFSNIMMKKILTVGLLALVLAVSMGGVASATHGGAHPTQTIPTGITTAQGFIDLLEVITDWIFVLLLIIAVIFIVLAALQFISGGGDPAAVSEARTKLIWAAVGIGVALLARGLPPAVRNIIGP